MKILAFAGSNADSSINKKLVTYASKFLDQHTIEFLDLNDYEMPIYKIEREAQHGLPKLAYDFAEKIDESDFILLSLAEYNGAYSVAFKNVFDWVSRIPGRTCFGDKPMFLLATSPGKMGGATVLGIAEKRFGFNGGKVLDTFSLPFFYENFDEEKGITNEEKLAELKGKLENLPLS
ncbi:MAG: NAD(P)H-dependent oxidoreductase [Cruoricaptor ignavus]|nr:NAD(P)H-dependent oxidoreductase [Cruoricaptor ignavus]